MALPAACAWEHRPTNGSDNNGGGFALSGPTYPTDLAATVATSSAPVCTSASYNFVAGDVNQYLYIKSGTNWIPGFYKIASVAANAATLSAACATTASPTGGTWSIDYSQQNSVQVNIDNSVITTSVTTTTITFTGHTCTPAEVGNIVKVLTGTNTTVSRYVINSTTASTWVLDRAPITSGTTTNMTAKMGGAAGGAATSLDGLTAGTVMFDVNANGTAGNKFFVKAEATITTTATTTINPPAATPSASVMLNHLIGYTTTRGDGGQVTIKLSTNSALTGLNVITAGSMVMNFIVDASSLTTSICFSLGTGGTGRNNFFINCVAKNFTKWGFDVGAVIADNGTHSLINCEATGGTSAATGAAGFGNTGTPNVMFACYIHDNVCPGIANSMGTMVIMFNLITNNTGATSDGLIFGAKSLVVSNTFYQNGRHGINQNTAEAATLLLVRNNILVKNGGYGIQAATAAGQPSVARLDGNAFWSNTSGDRNNMDDYNTARGAGNYQTTNFINIAAPYTNTLDVTLTADPFVSASGNDYRLNDVSGAGRACKAAGTPGSFLNNSLSIGYLDMGAVQHKDMPTVINSIQNQYLVDA